MHYDLAWFQTTSWGKAWAELKELQYESAFILVSNDRRVLDVKENCPDLYDQVLAMSIAEFLASTVLGESGSIEVSPDKGDHEAYVTSDKVFDIQRSYALVKAAEETLKHKPLKTLDRIFEQCRNIVGVMRIAVGADDKCGCDGNFRVRRIRVGDMSDG